jgi:hypothetical protein
VKSKLEYEWVNPGDLDRTGRCRECEQIFSRPHAPGCSFGPGKVGSLRRRPVYR